MRLINYPDNMEGKFRFITIAFLRCRQLQNGAKPRVQSRSKKFTTIAQEEVLTDQVEWVDGELPQPGLETAKAMEETTGETNGKE